MPQFRKKIIAFAFLLIVALPVFISLKFLMDVEIMQQEVDEKMESATLQSINTTISALFWTRKGKEVIINGKLFDVKSFKTVNDIVTLTGFFDNEETQLQEQFTNTLKNNNSDFPFSQLVIKFLFFPTYTSQAEITCESNWRFISQQYYSFDEMIPVSPSLSFSPPPKL